MDRNRSLILAAAFLRAVAVGSVGVFLAIGLADRGLSLSTIGLVIGAGMSGAALTTALVGARVDQTIGRRRLLVLLSGLSGIGYLSMWLPLPAVALIVIAFVGGVNGMGRDRGGIGTLEQAVLPDTLEGTEVDANKAIRFTASTSVPSLTWTLAYYNLLLDVGHAVGAAAGALPALLIAWFAFTSLNAYGAGLLIAASALFVGALCYARLSAQIEGPANRVNGSRPVIAPETRSKVRTLAALFFVDSFGGGFLSSALVAYFFFDRFGLSTASLAALFVAARALNALSHLGAAWLAARIGLVNTMVFTHLPSSVFLMAAPSAPSAGLAVVLFLIREALVEMDVPTRQAYVLASVQPHERTYASGVTNLTRTLGWAAGPPVAGVLMQFFSPAAPLIAGGALKIAYDLALYRVAKGRVLRAT